MKPTPLLIISILFASSFLFRGFEVAKASSAPKPEKTNVAQEMKKPSEEKHASAQKSHDDGHADGFEKADKETASDHDQSKKMGDGDEYAQKKEDGYRAQEGDMAMDKHNTPKVANIDLTRFNDESPDILLAEIIERAALLEKREAELANRARKLETLEKRIGEELAILKTTRDELEARLTYAEEAAREDISKLARMYENMKPAAAGEIFNAMEPSFAAGFLTEMNSESAAQILTAMSTDKAYAASILIAGRNADIHNN